MKISEKLKQRFCKDMDVSINIFDSPVFEERLKLFGRFEEYKEFVDFISREFQTEEDFFIYYSRLKDDIIDYIKHSEAYGRLTEFNMTGEPLCFFHDIGKGDIYKETNIGRSFISIDMINANFSSMVTLKNMKDNVFWDWSFKNLKPEASDYDYEKFMNKFTPYPYFAKSKYFRQMVFGNCCPKRQVYVEKYLISTVLREFISKGLVKKDDIYSIHSDEAILKAGNADMSEIAFFVRRYPFPLKVEQFTLGKLKNTDAYIKTEREDMSGRLPARCKCVNSYEAPFIYRFLKDEPVQESDRLFIFNGKPAKLLEVPDISLDLGMGLYSGYLAAGKNETESDKTESEEDGILLL